MFVLNFLLFRWEGGRGKLGFPGHVCIHPNSTFYEFVVFSHIPWQLGSLQTEPIHDSGIELTSLMSPALAAGFYTTSTTCEALMKAHWSLNALCIEQWLCTLNYSVFPSLDLFLLWNDFIEKLNSSDQSLSHVRLFTTSKTEAHQASLSIINSWSLLKLISIMLLMPSNHLILCRPLLLLSSIFPSIRVFSNESALRIRWPKDWGFSFNISPSNQYSGWISFRIDWLDLLAVQGTLKSLLQHHSSKASILWCSAFFIVQLPHPYMTTGKTIALTRWTYTGTIVLLQSFFFFNNMKKKYMISRDFLTEGWEQLHLR